MSVLLNSPEGYSSAADLIRRIFDVCPAMTILRRDPDNGNLVTRVEDSALVIPFRPSVEESLKTINTLINLKFYQNTEKLDENFSEFTGFADSYLPLLRENHGIWINVYPALDTRDKLQSALEAMMLNLVKKYADEEIRHDNGKYVSMINIKLPSASTEWFNAVETCLIVDYISKYRDILINMPGKELRLT